MKPKASSWRSIVDKLLKESGIKKRRHGLLISGMREVTTDATYTMSISEYYEQFYANKLKN